MDVINEQQKIIDMLYKRVREQNQTIARYRWFFESASKSTNRRVPGKKLNPLDPWAWIEWLFRKAVDAFEWALTRGINLVLVILEWAIVKALIQCERLGRRLLAAFR